MSSPWPGRGCAVAELLSDAQLDAIRVRVTEMAKLYTGGLRPSQAARDRAALLAEVDRLREVGRAQSAMCMAAELERDVRLPAKAVERFLKRERDTYEARGQHWNVVDDVLDAFRLHLVTGTPLTSPRPTEGPEAAFVGEEPLTEAEELRAEVELLRGLVKDLADPDPCWHDHHGGCQAHGYLSLGPGERCPHAAARELLNTGEVASDG